MSEEPLRLDIPDLSPQDFARLVRDVPKADLKDLMQGELREQVLDEVFRRMEEQFLPKKAGKRQAVVHWKITDSPSGEPEKYELVIRDGKCVVRRPPEEKPRVIITLDAVAFLELTSGNASGTTMFMTRKLKLDGDLGLGAGLLSMFAIPKADGPKP